MRNVKPSARQGRIRGRERAASVSRRPLRFLPPAVLSLVVLVLSGTGRASAVGDAAAATADAGAASAGAEGNANVAAAAPGGRVRRKQEDKAKRTRSYRSCEVCELVLGGTKDVYTEGRAMGRSDARHEEALLQYCAMGFIDGPQQQLCYIVEPFKRDIAGWLKLGMPVDRACAKLVSMNPDICRGSTSSSSSSSSSNTSGSSRSTSSTTSTAAGKHQQWRSTESTAPLQQRSEQREEWRASRQPRWALYA